MTIYVVDPVVDADQRRLGGLQANCEHDKIGPSLTLLSNDERELTGAKQMLRQIPISLIPSIPPEAAKHTGVRVGISEQPPPKGGVCCFRL
jgi:hypothetical protein